MREFYSLSKFRALALMLVFTVFGFYANATVWPIPNTTADTLEHFIEDTSAWNAGDTIMVIDASVYQVGGTVDFFQEGTLMGNPELSAKPTLQFEDNGFRAKEDTISISIIGLKLNGWKSDTTRRNHVIRFDQGAYKNWNDISIKDCEIWGFKGVAQLHKNKWTTYESFTIDNCLVYDLSGDYVIDPKLNAVKNLTVTNSTFYNITHGFISNVYYAADGRELVDQTIKIDHNTFFNVAGTGNKSLVQMNDIIDGSIDFSFSNNIVQKLYDDTLSRAFMVNELAGDFMFNNSVFYDYYSTYDAEQYNLDTIVLQSNVDTSKIFKFDPKFLDTEFYNFTISAGNPLLIASTTEGPIGDPRWVSAEAPWVPGANCHFIPNLPADSLEHFIEDTAIWSAGDTIVLVSNGEYAVGGTIDINKEVTILGDLRLKEAPIVHLYDNGFRLKSDSLSVTIQNLRFNGYNENAADPKYAPFILRMQLGSQIWKNIILKDLEAWNTKGILDLDQNKHSIYDTIIMENIFGHDFAMSNEWVLDPNINYVKYLLITECTFSNMPGGFLKNPDWNKDGLQLDIPKKWIVDHNTFYKVGGSNNCILQINDPDDGSVDLTFTNNIVSKLYDNTNVRPFRIREEAGDFLIGYSVFNEYDVITESKMMFNLDTVANQANIDTTNIYKVDPMFADTVTNDFTIPDTSPLYSASTTGGYIGAKRWAPLAIGDPVVISPILVKVIPGKDYEMVVTVTLPDDADKTVTWSVENLTGEATIDATSGVLSTTKVGTVKVIATSNFNPGLNDELIVTIEKQIMVSSITLTPDATEITNFGGFINIAAVVEPGNADDKSLEWTINDETLASISEATPTTAKLNALGCGVITVTCTAADGLPFAQMSPTVSKTVDITISGQFKPESITVTAPSAAINTAGGTLQMGADFTPATACDVDVTWKVSDEAIATIDDAGLLTAVGNGVVQVIGKATGAGSTVRDTMDINVSNQVGIIDTEIANLTVSPNPATQSVLLNTTQTAEVVITNLLGKTMVIETVEPNSTIDISSLKSGIYIVNVKIENQAKAIRLVKQ